MSKAVLVMDMPENCYNCTYCNSKTSKNPCCALTNYAGGYQSMILEGIDKRQSWCPLREMPKKDTQCYFPDEGADGYANGWNACIDRIEGKCGDE